MRVSLKNIAFALLVSITLLTTPAISKTSDFIKFMEETTSSIERVNNEFSRLAAQGGKLTELARTVGLPDIISGVRDFNKRLSSLEKLVGSEKPITKEEIRKILRAVAKSSGEMYDNYPSIAKKRKDAFEGLHAGIGEIKREINVVKAELGRLKKIEKNVQVRLNTMDRGGREYEDLKLNHGELTRAILQMESMSDHAVISQQKLSKELSKLDIKSDNFASFFRRLKLLNMSIRRSLAVDEFNSNMAKALASIEAMPDFEELGEIIKDSLDIFSRIDQEFNNLTPQIPAF